MKKTLATITILTGLFIATPSLADKEYVKTAAYGYDTYTCEELTELEYEKVGSVVYYIRGHYDSKNDIWADYEPGKQTVIEDDFYIPVEDIYDFCIQNPKNTVSNAIVEYND